MRRLFTAILFACLTALPATAAELTLGCFVRHYSAEHLAARPDQIVASIWLKTSTFLFPHAGMEPELIHLAGLVVLTARQGHVEKAGLGGQVLDAGLFCHPPNQSHEDWVCSIDGDGGAIYITRDDGKVLVFRTQYLSVGELENDDGTFGGGRVFNLAEKPETYVTYRLYRVDDAVCDARWPEEVEK